MEVSLSHERHYLQDVGNAVEQGMKMESLIRKVQLFGTLSVPEKTKLMEITERCPMHRTLHNKPQVITTLV